MFKINDYAFDTYAKETVEITNGIEKEGVFEPTEAIALRCFGWDNGRAVMGWTYRRVEKAYLRPITCNKFGFNFPKRRGKYFVGRV